MAFRAAAEVGASILRGVEKVKEAEDGSKNSSDEEISGPKPAFQ